MRGAWVLVLAVGCGGSGDAPTWTHDVQPIVEGRCASCHGQDGIGPFPLTSYEQVSSIGEIVANAVESRAMPPWKAAPGHLDYLADPSLTDEQIALVRDWVDAGMPEGDPDDMGEPLPPVSSPLPRVDLTLQVPEPYLPANDPDDYRCFVLDWTGDTSYVTGFEVHPGNSSVVHHVAAFLMRPDNLMGQELFDTLDGWDAAEPGVGYTCFGGPSKTGEELAVPVQQLAQWVPGNGAVLFPEGVGIPVPAGSKIVLQMHYNTAAADGQPDQTTVDFLTEPDVARIGAFAPWLDAGWTLGSMIIPPNADGITHVAEGDPLSFFDLLLDDIDLSNGFDIHAAMLHMHLLGDHGMVRLDRADGSEQVLLEVPEWDFDWQLNYAFAEPVAFAPGDALYLSCTFDNTGGATAVGWGEGSTEEMCVGNLFVSAPK